MQLLCIAALLLSAVAACPDCWGPWTKLKFPPADGPNLDEDSKRDDDEQSVTQAPEDGDVGSVGDSDHPVGTQEMPPWLPNRATKEPVNGNLKENPKRIHWNDYIKWRPMKMPTWGKREAPDSMNDEPGVSDPGLERLLGRPRGPPRDKWRNRKNPSAVVFSPTFKVDNMTFQTVTGVTLKEGENVFLMAKTGGRGHHHHKGGRHGPPMNGQYVKLIYNSTEPNTVSIEYGVVKPVDHGEIVGEEDNPEEDY